MTIVKEGYRLYHPDERKISLTENWLPYLFIHSAALYACMFYIVVQPWNFGIADVLVKENILLYLG